MVWAVAAPCILLLFQNAYIMKYLMLCLLLQTGMLASAQFQGATLQASGLTCAMCSNAIHKSLSQLSFIASIEPELEKSAFLLKFKPGAEVNFDAMRKKVEDAGFFVARLEVSALFHGEKVQKGQVLHYQNMQFWVAETSATVLQGEKSFIILDKNFVPAKELKKYQASIRTESYKTGLLGGSRIYHISI